MDYYSQLGTGYLELHREEQAEKFRILASMINPEEHEKLLDVGCGPGWAEGFFNCRYEGIDPAEELVKMSPKCRIGTGENLPYANKSFDIVICVSALHNIENAEKALDEIKRVAKERARIGLTVLKKSRKAKEIIKAIEKRFEITQKTEQHHDIIFLCKR